MRICYLLLFLLISYSLHSQNYRTQRETLISYRPDNTNGKDLNIRFRVIYDVYFQEPRISAVAKVESEGDFVYFNGTRYSRNDIGEDIFSKIEPGNLDVAFDIFQGNIKISTVHLTNLISFDVSGSPDWSNLWTGVGAERAKEIFKEGFQIRNARVTKANFGGFYALESFLEKKQNYEEALRQANSSNSTKDKIDNLKRAERYAPTEQEKENIKTQIEQLEELLEQEKDEEKLKILQEKIRETDDPDEKIALLEESKKYSSDPSELDTEIEQIKRQMKQEEEEEERFSDEVEEAKESVNSDEDTYEQEDSSERRARAKQKADEQERERKRQYALRKQQQNQENERIATASAAASASFFYLLGGVIYSKYGKTNPNKLYTGSNLFTNFDIGLGLSVQPIYFASEYETSDYDYIKKTEQRTPITFDLNLNFQIGYETDYVGGYVFGSGTAGISPIFDATQLNYNYGGRAYAGLKNLKLFAEYENGGRNISASDYLDSREYGSGKSNYGFTNVKAGIRISWFGSRKAPARNHIYLGLIEEKISSVAEGQNFQRLPMENEPYVFSYDQVYTGYMFEWRHDHHGLLFAKVFPKYPATGERGGSLSDDFSGNEGWLFFQVGFVRSFTSFH
jgi:hypothetical protein